jgi:hypothetical protein
MILKQWGFITKARTLEKEKLNKIPYISSYFDQKSRDVLRNESIRSQDEGGQGTQEVVVRYPHHDLNPTLKISGLVSKSLTLGILFHLSRSITTGGEVLCEERVPQFTPMADSTWRQDLSKRKKKAPEGGAEEVAGACHAFWRNTGSFLRFWDGFKETFHWESIQFGNWEMGFVETEDLRERKRELVLW